MIDLAAHDVAPFPSFTNARALSGIALYSPTNQRGGNRHDQASREVLVARLATLLRLPLRPEVVSTDDVGPDVLLVPRETLVDGVGPQAPLTTTSLLGGRVPHAFVATKAITHGLIHPDAACPPGWSSAMAERLGDAALDGYTAFCVADALEAGRRLLETGPARVKDVNGKASLGQTVVRNAKELDAVMAEQDSDELARFGVVIEENMDEVETYSVGSLSVAGLEISYVGDQQETVDHKGRTVYGGSRLRCVRGGLDRLTHLGLQPEAVEAVRCAAVFDDAARRAYPDMILTRRNYDVLAGRDVRRRRRVGVLEQSWRVGGATGAEVAALEAFARFPDLLQVETATVEVYGKAAVPEHAVTYFSGVDPRVGAMTKYAVRLA
ncbi:DUF3182 family protein [Brevundimonas sp. S30B]|uniref:DUF3182 family protein n=1 Tax=unclassified Brevundimonas TaxID=2622653 RepID=UPI0010720AF4|nr:MULTISPECIES: DUF3182 family protein [unclassified Brevundimonas]QBX38070.1 DUF3182 family protein [Brevundimonas sp. MF30-B]TFW02576.1 DUF3182 family protein [Brevundimonas sp. S30B]